MTRIDELPDAAATCTGSQYLGAVPVAALDQLRLHGADVGLIVRQQRTASKDAPA